MKPRLIITGASGFLGYHLMRMAQPHWQIYGFTHRHSFSLAHTTPISCNLTNYIELGNYIDDIEPDAIIHAAAISDANYCQQHKEEAYTVNVEATKNLAGIASDFRVPFVFTSTDLVFDGGKGNYTETDPVNPLSTYGEQKARAEAETLHIYPEATVMRLPLMFGHSAAPGNNHLQQLMAQNRAGQKSHLFTDEYRSVCGARSIAQGILALMHKATGLLHVAGPQRLSRYTLGMLAAEAFQLDSSLIAAVQQKDVKMAAPRPADVSLDISKALALGYSPVAVKQELALIAGNNYL